MLHKSSENKVILLPKYIRYETKDTIADNHLIHNVHK